MSCWLTFHNAGYIRNLEMVMKVCWKLTKLMPCEQHASLLLTEQCVYIALKNMAIALFPSEAIVQSQR